MPEGDTIYRAARTLHRALAGHVVTRFETQYAQLARVDDDAAIVGRMVERVSSRGKHLLMSFSSGSRGAGPLVLRTHMRMSGSWHIYRVGEAWQRSAMSARIVIGTDTFVAVAFSVPVAEFVPASALDDDEAIVRLGPDVLSPAFDAAAAAARLAASDRLTAAEALLHQPTVSGIGNVYKSEVLFLAGIDPFAAPTRVSVEQWTRTMEHAQALMRANVIDAAETGMPSPHDRRRTTGRQDPAARYHVYRREGHACRRCGTRILMRHHGEHNRSTYWCPACQGLSPAG